MKDLKFIFLFIIIVSSLGANNFEIVDFAVIDSDFFAETNYVLDRDEKYCSAIKIEGNYPRDLGFKEKVYKVKKNEGTPYFFIDADLKKITLQAEGFQDFKFEFKKNLTVGKVYLMRLDIITEEFIKVKFKVKPNNAKIVIDERIISKNNAIESLEPGKYKLNIEAEGFLPLEKEILVNPDNNRFSFELEEDFGWLEYKTKPEGGELEINKIKVPDFGKIKLPLGDYEAVYMHPKLGKKNFLFEIKSQEITRKIFEISKTKEIKIETQKKEKTERELTTSTSKEEIVNNFKFKISEVKLEGEKVVITTEITNLDSDRDLLIRGTKSNLYDNLGNKYIFKDHKIANNKFGYSYNLEPHLINKITVQHILRISPKDLKTLESIPKIEFNCNSENQDFKVIFRDINL